MRGTSQRADKHAELSLNAKEMFSRKVGLNPTSWREFLQLLIKFLKAGSTYPITDDLEPRRSHLGRLGVGAGFLIVLLVLGAAVAAAVFFKSDYAPQANALAGNTVTSTVTEVSVSAENTLTVVSLQTQTITETQSTTISTTYTDTQQVAALQALLALKNSSEEYKGTTQGSDGKVNEFATFQATYAGYILVNGTSDNTGLYVLVSDSFNGYQTQKFTIGTSSSAAIPVVPGKVIISVGAPCGVLGCSIEGGTYSTTLTVTYFY